MDLLVLADSDGVVDMTPEAISRRSNVPIDQVNKYILELQQPDPLSRSKMEEGKRIVSIDPLRGWGWKIVNYHHYRKIRDEEARRSYFRDAKRKQRKKSVVKDTLVDKGGRCQIVSSSSLSACVQKKFKEWIEVRKAMGKAPKDWNKMFGEQIKWLKKFSDSDQIEILSQSIRNNWQGLFEPKKASGVKPTYNVGKPLDQSKIEVPERFKAWIAERYPTQREIAMKWRVWSDVPKNGIREEWWREEKKKLPVGELI